MRAMKNAGRLTSALILICGLWSARPAEAMDYTITDQASCLAFGAAIGGADWYGGGIGLCTVFGTLTRGTCVGPGACDLNRLFVKGVPLRAGFGGFVFTNFGYIEIDRDGPEIFFYGEAFVNRGTVKIGGAQSNYVQAIALALTNWGTLTSAVFLENFGELRNECGATLDAPVAGAVIEECSDPSISHDADAKCQDSIAKRSGKYSADRYSALAACHSSLLKGKALFVDKAHTTPITLAQDCASEYKTAGKIAKARQVVRDGVERNCSDALLGAHGIACGVSIDALADATGSTGCVIGAVDDKVEQLILNAYGY